MFKDALNRFERLSETLPHDQLEAVATDMLRRLEKAAAASPAAGFFETALGSLNKGIGRVGTAAAVKTNSVASRLNLWRAKRVALAAAGQQQRAATITKIRTETALRNRLADRVRSGELRTAAKAKAPTEPTPPPAEVPRPASASPLKKGLAVGGLGLATGLGVGSMLAGNRERRRQTQAPYYQ